MGRSNHYQGLYAAIEQICMRGPAFQRLSVFAKLARLEFDMAYQEGGRQNPVQVSIRYVAELLGVSLPTAAKVLRELDDNGFLVVEQLGKMRGRLDGRTTVYRLTWKPTNDGVAATFDNRRMDRAERLDVQLGYTSTYKSFDSNVQKTSSARTKNLAVKNASESELRTTSDGDSQWSRALSTARSGGRIQ